MGSAGLFAVKDTGFPTPVLTESGALPSGVTFNAGAGILGGTPAVGAGGSYPLTFTASNGVGANAIQSFVLTVNQSPAITSANQTIFAVGSAGLFAVKDTGFPTPVLAESGALPSGVTFDANSATLGGTPAADAGGTYPLTFTASNGVGADATQTFTLTIGQVPAITSTIQATFNLGSLNTFTLLATGTPTPALSESGTLPAGVTFNSTTDILSGSPQAGSAGTYVLTFKAFNGIGPGVSQGFTLIVQQTANRRFLEQVCEDLLGRAADLFGLAYWSGQLDQGVARTTIVNQIDHSGDYFTILIKSAYQLYLGRRADPSGLTVWLQQLGNGMTDELLQAGLIGSPEYYQHAGGTNQGWVDALYQNISTGSRIPGARHSGSAG